MEKAIKVISVKLPQPSVGGVSGRTMQTVLNSLLQKITVDYLDRRVKNLRIDKEKFEIQIHFEVVDEDVTS